MDSPLLEPVIPMPGARPRGRPKPVAGLQRMPDDPSAKGSFPGEVRPARGGGGSGPRGGGDGCTGGAIRVHHPEGPGGHVHGGGKRQGRLVVWYWQPVPVNAGTEPVPRGGPKRWRAPRARELRAGASPFVDCGGYIRCILQIWENKAAFVGRIRRSLVFFFYWDSLLSAEVTYAVCNCSFRRVQPMDV